MLHYGKKEPKDQLSYKIHYVMTQQGAKTPEGFKSHCHNCIPYLSLKDFRDGNNNDDDNDNNSNNGNPNP